MILRPCCASSLTRWTRSRCWSKKTTGLCIACTACSSWRWRSSYRAAHRESRKAFYDWLARTITIDGIQKIERDTEFDNETYHSGGIRLYYPETTRTNRISRTVLLEAGFDTVAPNIDKDISSWAYD